MYFVLFGYGVFVVVFSAVVIRVFILESLFSMDFNVELLGVKVLVSFIIDLLWSCFWSIVFFVVLFNFMFVIIELVLFVGFAGSGFIYGVVGLCVGFVYCIYVFVGYGESVFLFVSYGESVLYVCFLDMVSVCVCGFCSNWWWKSGKLLSVWISVILWSFIDILWISL